MSRRRQRERTIQAHAIRWLANRVATRPRVACVFATDEARIRRSVNGAFYGRADGLIAVQFDDKSIHTIALEVKSWRTRQAVAARDGCGAMFAWTVAVLVLEGVVIGACAWYRWGWVAGVSVGTFGGGALAFLFLRWASDSSRFSSRAVVVQVKRYPAGERWIAVTRDLAVARPQTLEALVAHCRAEAIGLVVVPRRGVPEMIVDTQATKRSDELVHYEAGETVRDLLANAPSRVEVRIGPGRWRREDVERLQRRRGVTR